MNLRAAIAALAGCATLLVAAPTATAATTRSVPGDYATIQAAIDASSPGDTVLVAPGTYNERINFGGKAITVASSDGAQVTIIDGGAVGTVVTMIASAGESPTLRGFTVRNGRAQFNAGGILTRGGPALIEENRVVANLACGNGAGIAAEFSSATIRDNFISSNAQRTDCFGGNGAGVFIGGAGSVVLAENTIEANTSRSSGGGIFLNAAGTPLIAQNLMRWNYSGSQGGAIYAINDSRARIENNLIVYNDAVEGAGIYSSVPSGSPGLAIVNNTLVANTSTIGRAGSTLFSTGFTENARLANNVIVGAGSEALVYCDATYDPTPPVVQNNDVFNQDGGAAYGGSCAGAGGTGGNIGADPLFADVPSQDYHLTASSPLIDAGTNLGGPSVDYDGNPRPLDGDGDGTRVTDMGAYELLPPDQDPPVITVVDLVVNTTSQSGAVVNYTVSASDDTDPAPTVSCAPASGSLFPIGITTVTCVATDFTAKTSSASFSITVLGDQDPPVITAVDVVANGTGPSGAVVNYTVSVSDDIDPAPAVSCAPASGALFPIGVTTVACVATDFTGKTSSASFSVTVLGALEQITSLRAAVAGLPDAKLARALDAKLRDAAAGYQASNMNKACSRMADFEAQVSAQSGKGIPVATATQWLADANRIEDVMGCL